MRGPLARTVLSIWSWLVLAVSLVVVLPFVAIVRLVTAPFDKGAYAAGLLFRKVVVIQQRLNPMWHFTMSGTPPSDPRRPYMVVSNHESFVDILLIAHLPFEMKWLSKSDFFKIPVVGWNMRLVRDIRLERGSAKSRAKALTDMKNRLASRVSVMVFPEGTRSKDGRLGEFHTGAFRVAIQAGVPVLPIAVIGTRSALVKNDWRFGFSDAEVRVLDPISTDGLSKADVESLAERARSVIDVARHEMARERGIELPD